jgi:hypothetical protein
MLVQFDEWFTAQRRKAVYAFVVVLVPALVVAGWMSPAQVEPVLTLAAVALEVLAGVLQLRHMSLAGAADWFRRSGRQAVYGLALAVAPAAAALGWVSDAAQLITGVSAVLSIGAAVLAVVFLRPDADPDPAPF